MKVHYIKEYFVPDLQRAGSACRHYRCHEKNKRN